MCIVHARTGLHELCSRCAFTKTAETTEIRIFVFSLFGFGAYALLLHFHNFIYLFIQIISRNCKNNIVNAIRVNESNHTIDITVKSNLFGPPLSQ